MNRSRVVAAVVSIIFLSSVVLLPFANADWTTFHANTSHSGAGTGNSALTSTLLWSYTTYGMVYSSPAVVGGVVYVGSEDGNVYALNASNGLRDTPSVVSSPAVVGGVVYVGSEDGNVYALNAANGAELWNYTTGAGIRLLPLSAALST